jgi:hypothetical protein
MVNSVNAPGLALAAVQTLPSTVRYGDRHCTRPARDHRGQDRAGDKSPVDPDLTDSLTVMALFDDVIRYLQRHHTVVPADEPDRYLVDGQSRETAVQLVEWANRMRRSEKLPCFTLMPTIADRETAPETPRCKAPRNIRTTPAKRATPEKDELSWEHHSSGVTTPWRGCDADGKPLTADHPRFS